MGFLRHSEDSTVQFVLAVLYAMHCSLPCGAQIFYSSQFDFVPVAMISSALALYLWGVRRNNLLHPRPLMVGRQNGRLPRRTVHHGRGDLQLHWRLRR